MDNPKFPSLVRIIETLLRFYVYFFYSTFKSKTFYFTRQPSKTINKHVVHDDFPLRVHVIYTLTERVVIENIQIVHINEKSEFFLFHNVCPVAIDGLTFYRQR